MSTPPLLRRGRQVILVLYICAVVGSVAMVVGPLLNDLAISRGGSGRALAEVTGVSATRTTAEFRDAEGYYHAPEEGLLYPTGLGEGQSVWVTYSRENPELAKVEGRGWTLAVIPALSVLAVSTVIAGLLWWVTGLSQRRRSRRGTA